jgi:hypothetical protein
VIKKPVMKIKLFILNLLILNTTFVLLNCKKEDAPCKDEKAADAEFKVFHNVLCYFESWWPGKNNLFENDTFLPGGYTFSLTDKSFKKCYWKIGYDTTIREGDNLFLVFDKPFGSIEITCMVEKDVNSKCFSSADSRCDTVTKTIFIIDYEDAFYIGKFSGYVESNPDSVINIEIIHFPNKRPRYRINNFFQGCIDSSSDFDFRHSTYEFYSWLRPYPCMYPRRAHGILAKNKKDLIIDFYTDTLGSNNEWITTRDKFIGRKIK